ncbi:MAG: ABC transporter permease [Rhizobium pusense]|nr:ABC transporter permease [Agrobacterium pusense]
MIAATPIGLAVKRAARHAPLVGLAAACLSILLAASLLAPFITPFDPYNLASIDLAASLTPPQFSTHYLLGADEQGRDVLSIILYGLRSSILVGFGAILVALSIGVPAGLVAGYRGGLWDQVLMRLADIQLSLPSLIAALFLTGIFSAMLGSNLGYGLRAAILISSIGLTMWPQFARTVRASTMEEKGKEYVQAARILRQRRSFILLNHILPNITGPITVLATLNLGQAIIAEATLSFLGVGFPPTVPTLGTLVRIGGELAFGGIWWVTTFSCIALSLLVLCITVIGEFLQRQTAPEGR